MEGAGAPKIPGADKMQEHSVSFKTIVITVYPEVFWRADAFQLIGFGSFATFCTFDRGLTSYQLPALSLCLLSFGLFLHPIDNNNGNNDNQDNANENNDRKKTKQRQ